MKPKIIATDKEHLLELIQKEIYLNGNQCNLNHIDTSLVTDMSFLFNKINFNGNISEWDVSNVIDMKLMFAVSNFNGDISKWNVSKVELTYYMFTGSEFNGDISDWDVSNVRDMDYMFLKSEFNQDLSKWKPYSVIKTNVIFEEVKCIKPYWAEFGDNDERRKAIEAYWLSKELNRDLDDSEKREKKIKL